MEINYDKDADVLYITIDDCEAIADELNPGIFIRYRDDYYASDIVGITIMDFKEKYIGDDLNENLETLD